MQALIGPWRHTHKTEKREKKTVSKGPSAVYQRAEAMCAAPPTRHMCIMMLDTANRFVPSTVWVRERKREREREREKERERKRERERERERESE